jgi:hypothetical protein
VSERERRCPTCGALASADAAWCGQCFTSLTRAPEPVAPTVPPSPDRGPAAAAPAEGSDRGVITQAPSKAAEPTWPCPACETENPIELDACRLCGTSFASLMRQDDAPPTVDPRDAFVRSLAFPGLGHRSVGRVGDGLARAVLFVMTLAIAGVAILSDATVPAIASMALLFGALAIFIYVGTAFEAARMARGAPAFLSSRAILWIVVGLLMGSVLILTVVVVAARPPTSP